MHIWKHFSTITRHRHKVIVHCFMAGIFWQGLRHDLSKYSPAEFIPGAKNYLGDKSPNEKERERYGFSRAWLHHQGRNKHHFEYWVDYNPKLNRKEPVEMPTRYLIEMFCDRVAASKIYYGDVTKKESLSSVFENIDGKEVYVIHCAGVVYIKSKYNPIVYDVNVNGTKNIVDKVLEIDAKLIYVSSVHSITEKPNNEKITEITNFDSGKVVGLYAKTKAEAAKYVIDAIKNKNLNACIIHPSGIIGPNDYGNSHLTQLIKEVATGKLFACVKGGYNFVDVRDVADGIISACDKNNRGECYILSNKYITIKELTDFVCDLEEKKRIKIVLPLWLAKLVAPICELYYNIKKQTPLFTKYSLYTLSSNSNFSNEKAKKELEYKNRDMKDTIKDTIKWLKRMNYIK
mgnify:CR=1 FL=1